MDQRSSCTGILTHPFVPCITTIFRLLPQQEFTTKSGEKSRRRTPRHRNFCRTPLWRTWRTCSRADPPEFRRRQAADPGLPPGPPDHRGMDETEDRTEEIPEPYIIVRTNEGNIQDANSPQEIDMILVVCVYDKNPNRQGIPDVPRHHPGDLRAIRQKSRSEDQTGQRGAR